MNTTNAIANAGTADQPSVPHFFVRQHYLTKGIMLNVYIIFQHLYPNDCEEGAAINGCGKSRVSLASLIGHRASAQLADPTASKLRVGS